MGQFLAWCSSRGLTLRAIAPLHVAAYIRTHPGSVPTVKQHLAATRALCDWLVVHQVLPVNPAARCLMPDPRRTESPAAGSRAASWPAVEPRPWSSVPASSWPAVERPVPPAAVLGVELAGHPCVSAVT